MGSFRFGFPKAPLLETLIPREPGDIKHRVEIIQASQNDLVKVHKMLKDNKQISMHELLQKSDVSLHEYTNSLKVSQHDTNIVLKCLQAEIFTNGCNPDFLHLKKDKKDSQGIVD